MDDIDAGTKTKARISAENSPRPMTSRAPSDCPVWTNDKHAWLSLPGDIRTFAGMPPPRSPSG